MKMNPFKKDTYSDNEPTGEIISFIGSDFIEGNTDIDESFLQETLPILPLRNTIVFPGSTTPISVGRRKSIDLVKSLGSNSATSASFVKGIPTWRIPQGSILIVSRK